MARPKKQGLEYTRLDVDFIHDRKIRKLKRLVDASAPLVYIQLMCTIFKEGYYIKWDEDLAFDIADATGFDEDYVNKVINICFDVGLLSLEMFQEHRVLTSHGIQAQYAFSKETSKSSYCVNEYSLLVSPEETPVNSEETPASPAETPVNSEETPASPEETPVNSEETPASPAEIPQRKEKNNKLKETSFYYSSPEEEQQEILSLFFFKNWAAPSEEVKKFLAFNNTGGRHWDKMDSAEKQAALELWKQKPQCKPRLDATLLASWQDLYNVLICQDAPLDVLRAATDDNIGATAIDGKLILSIPRILKDYIEKPEHLEGLSQVLLDYMRKCNCTKLSYNIKRK